MDSNNLGPRSPFIAMLRFAHLQDAGGQRDVLAFVKARASALRPKDPEDATQIVLWKIFRGSEQALVTLLRMAQKNPALSQVLSHLEPGAMPALDPAVVSDCDLQLSGYVSQMIRNGEKDRVRHLRFTGPLPPDDMFGGAAPQLDDEAELAKLGGMAFATAVQSDGRPEWLQGAVEEIQALARADRTMDELTAGCIAGDAELAAIDPAVARVRARNRLQQRHKRAREHIMIAIRSMVTDGKLTADEGRDAERWLGLLKRRQKGRSRASRGTTHDE